MFLKNKPALSLRGSVTTAAIACLLLLLACGDDTTEVISQSGQSYIEVVAEESDLPECTEDNEGEQVLVKGEVAARTCVDGEWTDAFVPGRDTIYLISEKITCYTKELADKQGVKIICDGDSVGVILNGESGAQGDKGDKGDKGADGAGCSLEQLDSVTARLVCGSDTMTVYLGLPADTAKTVPTDEIDSEKIPVSLDSLVGYAQFGRDFSNLDARISGLGDGYSIRRSGGFYTNDVSSSDGYYKFRGFDFPSQYAMLEVEGKSENFFRAAMFGMSSGHVFSIRLRAIVDLTERTSANVNLLTEIEYDRVNYLVAHEGMTISQAKKQAQLEAFEQFYIDAKDFDASETLDMWGESDADAALLAVSAMVNLTTSEMLAKTIGLDRLLSDIESAIKITGKWNGGQVKAELADQLMELGLSKIRDYVEWGRSGKVGNFEKYIKNFIEQVYAIEPCGDGSELEQRIVNNEKSANHGKTFHCHEGILTKESKNTFTNPEIDYGWMVDMRDRHAYRTVKIGDQTWMAENLNYEYKVRNVIAQTLYVYVPYGNACGADSCEVYGRYYTYAAAMDSAAVFSDNAKGCGYDVECTIKTPARGICPEGWHIPTGDEWRALYSAMGESPYAMQAKGFDGWPDATDAYGFSALPAGGYMRGAFYDVGGLARFWGATEFTEYDNHTADYWYLRADGATCGLASEDFALSVRCIKDSAE